MPVTLTTNLVLKALVAGAVVTGLVAEGVVFAADAAGMSLERVALLVGIVTFVGSFVSATFMLGGRVREWSSFQNASEREMKRLRARLARAHRDREALIRALIRAGVLDEDVHGIHPARDDEDTNDEGEDNADA